MSPKTKKQNDPLRSLRDASRANTDGAEARVAELMRRAEAQNLRAWVLTIARRKAIDHHRSRSRGAKPVAEPEALIDRRGGAMGSSEAALGMNSRHSEIWAAVAELPPSQRAAVVLRFAVDLRYREVGQALGTSEEAARQNVHEALKKLRASARDLKEMAR